MVSDGPSDMHKIPFLYYAVHAVRCSAQKRALSEVAVTFSMSSAERRSTVRGSSSEKNLSEISFFS